MSRYSQVYRQALKDIATLYGYDKRRTGFYNELEPYNIGHRELFNKEQRILNRELGINKVNYYKDESNFRVRK